MREYLLFLKDRSLVTAFIILVLMETVLQLGFYKPLLKKNSYASNVNRITDHLIEAKNKLNPNTLIMGTSIAYEGISLKMLNEGLKPYNIVSQSIAIPGADLMIQELALRKVLEHYPDIKYIIHVNEIQMPWVDLTKASDATYSMLGEFPKKYAFKKLVEDEYRFGLAESSFLLFKLIAYRRDIGEFLLSPEKRLKDLKKAKKEREENLYSYENKYTQSISAYHFSSLEECLSVSSFTATTPRESDELHKTAVYKTCKLAKETDLPLGTNHITELYKKRLKNIYQFIRSKNITIINVYPPLPYSLDSEKYSKRIGFWNSEYKSILGNTILDLYNSLPKENNLDYYYDMIHLNQKGMELFTQKLIEAFSQYIEKKDKGN